ncbi:MAG: CCC motif membrane protein [Myroides sp.]|nr:CCC motif membrane protein [uncultured Flavobacterium sp.]MDO5637813.1 CCC motif membrane protein [Myroides sp.]
MVSKLPNATTVLVMGIISILGCCCYGIIGIVCGIIGLVLAKKDTALYQQNPTAYNNYSNLNTGRILCIIGLVISSIAFISNIVLIAMYGFDGIQEMQQQWIEQMQMQQQL